MPVSLHLWCRADSPEYHKCVRNQKWVPSFIKTNTVCIKLVNIILQWPQKTLSPLSENYDSAEKKRTEQKTCYARRLRRLNGKIVMPLLCIHSSNTRSVICRRSIKGRTAAILATKMPELRFTSFSEKTKKKQNIGATNEPAGIQSVKLSSASTTAILRAFKDNNMLTQKQTRKKDGDNIF